MLEVALLSKSSHYGNHRAEVLFQKFLVAVPRKAFDSEEQQLSGFVAWFSLEGYKPATIKTYFAHVCKCIQSRNPSINSSEANSLIRGTYCLQQGKGFSRKPVTTVMLKQLISSLPNIAVNRYMSVLWQSMVSLMFFSLLQVGEVVQSDHTLHFQNVRISQNPCQIVLKFHMAKNDHTGQIGQVSAVHPKGDSGIDLVNKLLNYLVMRPKPKHMEEPLYVDMLGLPISECQFQNMLSKAKKILGWSHWVTSHSFRMGRATQLFLNGILVHWIKQMGRW